MSVYDYGGKSHSSPSFSYSRSRNSYKSEAQREEERKREQEKIERETRQAILPIPESVQQKQSHHPPSELWKEFRRTIYKTYGKNIALSLPTQGKTFVLGELIGSEIPLSVAVEIYTQWDHLWQKSIAQIEWRDSAKAEFVIEHDYSELEGESAPQLEPEPEITFESAEKQWLGGELFLHDAPVSFLKIKGKQLYQKKDHQKAYGFFLELLEREPNNTEALLYLGVSANQIGQHNKAITICHKWIESGHRTAQAYYFQAESYKALGQKEKAMAAYQKAGVEMPEAQRAFLKLQEEKLLGGFSRSAAKVENTNVSSIDTDGKLKQTNSLPPKNQRVEPTRYRDQGKEDKKQSATPIRHRIRDVGLLQQSPEARTIGSSTSNTEKEERDKKQQSAKQTEIDNNTLSNSGSKGIVISGVTESAVPGTKITYEVDLGDHLEPSDNFTYHWRVINDLSQVNKDRGAFSVSRHPHFVDLGVSKRGKIEASWDFPGSHVVSVEVYYQGKLRRKHQYTQTVQDPQTQAREAFETLSPPQMQSDVYITWLSTQRELARSQGAEEKQIQQIDEAIANATELLGVSQDNPQGKAIPLSATLVPTAEPQPAPLQLYVKPIDGGWAIVDLTNPDPSRARTYEGKIRTTGRQADIEVYPFRDKVEGEAAKRSLGRLEPSDVLSERRSPPGLADNAFSIGESPEAIAVERAWKNFVKNNPHPAGEIVAQFPAQLMEGENQTLQAHSDGVSTLGKVRDWFGNVGLVAGLGGLALTVATGGVGTVAVGLFITASASGVVAGGSNIADRVKHGNFEWDGETALDLVDIAGGLAGGTTAVLSLGGKAANITKLRNAMLIGEAVETSSDVAGGVILGAQYLTQIEEIKSDPNLTAEQKKEQISGVLAAAAATGGLMVLGTAAGVKTKTTLGTDVDVDTSPNNRIQGNVADTNNNRTTDTPVRDSAALRTNNLAPDSPLVRALPQELQGKVRIVVDENLNDATVRAYYKPEVHIKVGSKATAVDIELHVPTVRTLQRYAGLTGKVRALIERIANWIKRNGEPPVGTLAWEAKLELEKLPAIIEARQARLASGDIDAATRTQLEAQIADLEEQIAYHTRNLDVMDTNPSRGYVAAELHSDSPNALLRISEHTNNLEQILISLRDSLAVTQLSQRVETVKLNSSKLLRAETDGTLSSSEINAETESLIQEIDQINAEAIALSQSGLNETNTRLGSNALGEYKQWQQDLVDLEQLIVNDPQLKEQYTAQLRQQQLEWASVPGGNPELWYSMIREIARPELASLFNRAADDLIGRKTRRLSEIETTLSNIDQQSNQRVSQLTRTRGLSYGDAVTQAQQEVSRNYPELPQLRAEKTQLESSLQSIESTKRRIAGEKETERFASLVTPESAWERLKQNHDSGGESSSSKFASVLLDQGVIKSEQEIVTLFQTIEIKGKTLDSVRQQFKNQYRPELLKIIESQPAELRYQKMRKIAENLDVREQGEFSEYWYQIEVGKSRGVPNSTQITLDKTKAEQEYGIELTTKKNRRFDEVFGDENSATIREHKHIRTSLQGEQLRQYDDNIAIVYHNYEIDNKTIQGVPITNSQKDTPVILEKDGKKFRPDELVYTFATPEGVQKNADFMIRELERHSEYLSFEIINNSGKIKTIDIDNINDLHEPALSQWLGFGR